MPGLDFLRWELWEIQPVTSAAAAAGIRRRDTSPNEYIAASGFRRCRKNSSYVYSIHTSATFYVFTFSKNPFLAEPDFFYQLFQDFGNFCRPMPGKGIYAAQDLDFGSI